MTLSQHHETARIGALAFSIYAACLLSFLAGVRAGFEIARAPYEPDVVRLLISALFVLAGWALTLLVVLVPAAIAASAAFAGLFALLQMWDHRSASAGAPPYYPVLRQVLTGGAMIICLIIPLATVLQRF